MSITPDYSQQQAIATIVESKERVSILDGGPGRGKSTCISLIIQALWDTGKATPRSTRIAATTGKAAKVIDESLTIDVEHRPATIHRMLGCQGKDWEYNQSNPLLAELLILDECSMLSSELLARVLGSVSPDCKIILTGDRHQLNPIDAGCPFFDLVEYGPPSLTSTLRVNWRQKQGSLIADASDRILARKAVNFGAKGVRTLKGKREDDLFFIEEQDSEKIIGHILPIVKPWYDKRYDYACLSPQRPGVVGLTILNEQMQKALNPAGPGKSEIRVWDTIFRKGDRVRVTKNNYNLDIFNGYVGWIEDILPGGALRLKFDEQEVVMSLPADIKNLVLAYVQTVHSVQGSGYDYGVFVCDSKHQYMLSNQLVYVAFSRFKEELHVVGQIDAFKAAMGNKRKNMRDTLLKLKFKGGNDAHYEFS